MRSYVQLRGIDQKLANAGDQAPFALALALTNLVNDAKTIMMAALKINLDRPVPFTEQAIGIIPATKELPVAQIFIKAQQAKYLGLEEEGGVRGPEPGMPVIVPVDITVNAYGNIPKGAISKAKATGGTFVAGKGNRLPPGVYQRKAPGRVTLLASLKQRAVYHPRLQFVATVTATIQQLAPKRVREAILQAISTRR